MAMCGRSFTVSSHTAVQHGVVRFLPPSAPRQLAVRSTTTCCPKVQWQCPMPIAIAVLRQVFHCPLPQSSAAVCNRGSTTHCPKILWQCACRSTIAQGLQAMWQATAANPRDLREIQCYTAATGHTFLRPIPTRQAAILDTWKDMATPLELRPPMTLDDPPASGRSSPVPSLARYIQSRPTGHH